jgi:hypothetical protein
MMSFLFFWCQDVRKVEHHDLTTGAIFINNSGLHLTIGCQSMQVSSLHKTILTLQIKTYNWPGTAMKKEVLIFWSVPSWKMECKPAIRLGWGLGLWCLKPLSTFWKVGN